MRRKKLCKQIVALILVFVLFFMGTGRYPIVFGEEVKRETRTGADADKGNGSSDKKGVNEKSVSKDKDTVNNTKNGEKTGEEGKGKDAEANTDKEKGTERTDAGNKDTEEIGTEDKDTEDKGSGDKGAGNRDEGEKSDGDKDSEDMYSEKKNTGGSDGEARAPGNQDQKSLNQDNPGQSRDNPDKDSKSQDKRGKESDGQVGQEGAASGSDGQGGQESSASGSDGQVGQEGAASGSDGQVEQEGSAPGSDAQGGQENLNPGSDAQNGQEDLNPESGAQEEQKDLSLDSLSRGFKAMEDMDLEDLEEDEGPVILDFYIEQNHIHSKDGNVWYAAYDDGRGESHVNLYVSVSSVSDCEVTVTADNGSRSRRVKASRISGSSSGSSGGAAGGSVSRSRSLFSLDFAEEGTWQFTSRVEDGDGKSDEKKLTGSGGSGSDSAAVSVVINDSCPELNIIYDGKPADGEESTIYYGKNQTSIGVKIVDAMDSFAGESGNRPELKWDAPMDMVAEESISAGEYGAAYTLSREGSYSFSLSYTSRNGRSPKIREYFSSGRQSAYEEQSFRSRTVIVDYTPPEVTEISLDEGGNKRCLVGDKDCIFLDQSLGKRISIAFTVQDDSSFASLPAICYGKWNTPLATEVEEAGKGIYRCRTSFDMSDFAWEEEGQFKLTMGELVDRAGNAGEASGIVHELLDPVRIVIDRTAPSVKVIYSEPGKVIQDSGRLEDNSTELFYREKGNIRLVVSEDNFVSGVSEEGLHVNVSSKLTDEQEYSGVESGEISLQDDGSGDSFSWDLAMMPDHESHSYFQLSFSDLSGNRAERITDEEGYGKMSGKEEGASVYTSPVITIDHTPPVITTSFAGNTAGSREGRDYYQEPQVMRIVVEDENFRCGNSSGQGAESGSDSGMSPGEGLSVKYSAYDFNPETEDLDDMYFQASWLSGETWDSGTYSGGVKQYIAEVEIPGQWNYTINTEAEDICKNKGDSRIDLITIDSQKPWITFYDVENSSKSDVVMLDAEKDRKVTYYDYSRYGYFHKGRIRVKVTGHDDTAGLSAIRYRVTHEDGRIVKGKWEFSEVRGEQTKYITIPVDAKARISLVPVDLGNLTGDQADPRGCVTESEAVHKANSKLVFKLDSEPSGVSGQLKYYNKPVSGDLIMEDGHSGIASYSYSAGTSLSQQHDYSDEAGSSDEKGDPDTSIIYARTFHLDLPAGDTNYSSRKEPTRLSASFTDNAGYESKTQEMIVMDDKKPAIKVEWSKADLMNEKYYRTDRTAIIEINERNFDEDKVRWKINNMTGVNIGKWSHEGDQHSCKVSFTRDGDDFLLDFDVTDLAGNSASCPAQQPFSIDKTPPVIRVTFDNNDVRNGKYYNKARIAVLHIEDHNFRESDVKCSFMAKDSIRTKNLYNSAGWTGAGDSHRNAVMCDADGEYNLQFTCTDLAGNKADRTITENFIIDRTAPLVRITGVRDGGSYNDVVAPTVEYTDLNLVEDSARILLTGHRNRRASFPWDEEVRFYHGKKMKWKDFRRTPSSDDIYTLEVYVEDKAGNRNRSASTTFTVNRFGSDYYFSKETDELVNGGNPYLNFPLPIEVTEVNVSPLKESVISVRNEDNEIVTLKEGTDYKVIAGKNKYSWNEYTYQIKRKNFEKEGQYSVTLSSIDEASNQMTNVTKDKEISFVIDKTRPYGIITGLEEETYKEDRHEFTVRADDNYALKEAVLYINGNKIKKYKPEDFLPGEGVTEALEKSSKVQRVSLKLFDRAGNAATILPRNNPQGSLVTSDHLILFLHSGYVLIGIVAALLLLLLICAGIWLLIRKRDVILEYFNNN